LRSNRFKKTALHTELHVYREPYKLVLEIFVSTKNFPKEYKYSLGRDMERDLLVLMWCIYRANRALEKTGFLNEFLDIKIHCCPIKTIY